MPLIYYFLSGDNSVTGVNERKQMKKLVQNVARGVLKVGDVIRRNGKMLVVFGFSAVGVALCRAQGTIADPTSGVVTSVTTDVGLIVGALVSIIVAFIGLAYLKRLKRG